MFPPSQLIHNQGIVRQPSNTQLSSYSRPRPAIRPMKPSPLQEIMIKIDQMAKPYLGQPQRNDNGYRFFGRLGTNNHVVEGIKYFPNGDIAVGTYDSDGLLHGQNCMYFFKDEQYTFGTYDAGELRTGEVHFLETKSIEKGPRNALLHLDGPGCQRILADQTVYNGTFSDGILDIGTISYANGTIVSVGHSTETPRYRTPRDEIADRISKLSKPYLSAPLVNNDGHQFYLLKRDGVHTEGIKKFKNGDIAIGSFDEKGHLTGPNGMYFFATDQIFVFGFNVGGNLRHGEVRFLDTNETEFGSRNEHLRLNGTDCRRVLADGTVEHGTFRDGRFKMGTITYPNGSSEVVLESSSIPQLSKIEPTRINTQTQEYNPFRMRSPYTFPQIPDQYSQDLRVPTRPLGTENQW